jgi:purine-nucleoside phosphorylase
LHRTNPESAARHLGRLSPARPRLALVLGSGFGGVAAALRPEKAVAYSELPGFPPTAVGGHAGKLCIGELGGTTVLALNGRAHFYEGHAMEAVTFPVRTLAAFGITDLLLTNAAGGINPRFRPGDFMVLTDHLNLMGTNPLRGPAITGLPRFVDLTQTYDPALRALLHRAAKATKLRLREGVYAAVCGPTYETPAEVRAFARWGADAVGMSTVPEAMVARQCGLRVAAVSCITNLAAGLGGGTLSHAEVLEVGKRAGARASALLGEFARLYGQEYETAAR